MFDATLIMSRENLDIEKIDVIKKAVSIYSDKGLEMTNDNYGHLAGDMIICGAASCIKEVFGNYGTVFRMGGDEYSAIIRYSQSDFSTLINELNEKAEFWNNQNQYKIAISIGYVFASEYPDKDIVFLEKEAEKRMYIDKNEYYQRTGLDRRKR